MGDWGATMRLCWWMAKMVKNGNTVTEICMNIRRYMLAHSSWLKKGANRSNSPFHHGITCVGHAKLTPPKWVTQWGCVKPLSCKEENQPRPLKGHSYISKGHGPRQRRSYPSLATLHHALEGSHTIPPPIMGPKVLIQLIHQEAKYI